jgi:hypothetical protein
MTEKGAFGLFTRSSKLKGYIQGRGRRIGCQGNPSPQSLTPAFNLDTISLFIIKKGFGS